MFYIEIERANGTKFAHTIDDEVLRFDTAEEADELAEAMWLRLGEFGNYARFSVIDPETGDSYSDWEC